jgi:hypothetical protein
MNVARLLVAAVVPPGGGWSRSGAIRTPNRQIRSLVLCVDLVGSRRIWPAHVGGLVGPDGSRRVPSDRLDDQADDQQAGHADEPKPVASQTWIWWAGSPCAGQLHEPAP